MKGKPPILKIHKYETFPSFSTIQKRILILNISNIYFPCAVDSEYEEREVNLLYAF